MPNTHAITAINKETRKREQLSMPSTQWGCKDSLDFYKQQFKEWYTHFKVQKLTPKQQ